MRVSLRRAPIAPILSLAFTLGLGAAPAFAQEEAEPQSTYSGIALYEMYCNSCHGPEGKGDGTFAAALRKPPADLTQIAKDNGGTYPTDMVFQIVDGRDPVAGHGGGDMPIWGDAFSRSTEGSSEDEVSAKIAALVRYIERLQEKP